MATFDREAYQPAAGDIYIQVTITGRFNVHRYDGQTWQQPVNISEQEAQALIFPMEFLGESRGKRQYYRPTAAKRTDTIANITTSVDDKDIDAWLDRRESER